MVLNKGWNAFIILLSSNKLFIVGLSGRLFIVWGKKVFGELLEIEVN